MKVSRTLLLIGMILFSATGIHAEQPGGVSSPENAGPVVRLDAVLVGGEAESPIEVVSLHRRFWSPLQLESSRGPAVLDTIRVESIAPSHPFADIELPSVKELLQEIEAMPQTEKQATDPRSDRG